MPALGDLSRNCSCAALHTKTYCIKGCEDFSPSEHEALLPLQIAVSLCLTCLSSVPPGRALSAAALCRVAAPGQSCLSAALPLAISSLCLKSPAQLSSRGTAQVCTCGTFSVPSGLSPGDTGAPGQPAVKQADVVTDVSSLSWGET